MISRIGARQYRCFAHLDIALPHYAVFAGANGTGKSTLLDIPVFIGDVLSEGLQRACLIPLRPGQGPRAQTFRELVHRGQGEHVSLLLEAELPAAVLEQHASTAPQRMRANMPSHLRYELRLRLLGDTSLAVEGEYLDLFPASVRSPDLSRVPDPERTGWRTIIERHPGAPLLIRAEFRRGHLPVDELAPDRLALSLISDRLLYPAATWLAELLREGTVPYAPDCTVLRTTSPPGQSLELMSDAANLPWQVRALQHDPSRINEWLGIVQLALPNVRSVRAVEREVDRHAYLQLTYRYDLSRPDADYPVTSFGLSDGTLRLLAFTILPYLERLPPVLSVEQPEDGIHPRAIDMALESLSALPETQALVSTHSPVVLARTPLEHLICMRRDDSGAAEAVAGPQHPRLREWRQEIDLGMLFAAGVLA